MSESPRYLLVSCTLDGSRLAEFRHSVGHARPLFAAHGGRPAGQYATDSVLVGAGETTHVIVMAFPSEAAIRAVFDDPAYQALIPARTAAFPRLEILIARDFDPRPLMAVPS